MSPSKKVPLIVSIVNAEYDANVLQRSLNPANSPLNEARYVAMYLIRENTSYTFKWIDNYFSFTNSYHMIGHISERMNQDVSLFKKVERLQQIFINTLKDSKK